MTPKQAWLYAAEWGSAMHGGDPGACMYGFDETGRPQSEEHRADCIEWIDRSCLPQVHSAPEHYESDEADKLAELRMYLVTAPLPGQNFGELDSFTQGYVTCALWSSNDNSDESGGDPLDSNYSEADIMPETLASMIEECRDFQQANAGELAEAYQLATYSAERAGHDFWLTRNGHGAGFWDRGLGDVGDKLTAAAKVYGGCDLYVGDDKKIYLM